MKHQGKECHSSKHQGWTLTPSMTQSLNTGEIKQTRNLHCRAMRMYPPALAAIFASSFCSKEGQTSPLPSLEQKDDIEIAASALDYCQH